MSRRILIIAIVAATIASRSALGAEPLTLSIAVPSAPVSMSARVGIRVTLTNASNEGLDVDRNNELLDFAVRASDDRLVHTWPDPPILLGSDKDPSKVFRLEAGRSIEFPVSFPVCELGMAQPGTYRIVGLWAGHAGRANGTREPAWVFSKPVIIEITGVNPTDERTAVTTTARLTGIDWCEEYDVDSGWAHVCAQIRNDGNVPVLLSRSPRIGSTSVALSPADLDSNEWNYDWITSPGQPLTDAAIDRAVLRLPPGRTASMCVNAPAIDAARDKPMPGISLGPGQYTLRLRLATFYFSDRDAAAIRERFRDSKPVTEVVLGPLPITIAAERRPRKCDHSTDPPTVLQEDGTPQFAPQP